MSCELPANSVRQLVAARRPGGYGVAGRGGALANGKSARCSSPPALPATRRR